MCEHLCGKPRPGLLDMPWVTPDQVASFYAAASFLRQAPWKQVGYDAAIRVECDRFQNRESEAAHKGHLVVGLSGEPGRWALCLPAGPPRPLFFSSSTRSGRPLTGLTLN
jgi:hypothetical protein